MLSILTKLQMTISMFNSFYNFTVVLLSSVKFMREKIWQLCTPWWETTPAAMV